MAPANSCFGPRKHVTERALTIDCHDSVRAAWLPHRQAVRIDPDAPFPRDRPSVAPLMRNALPCSRVAALTQVENECEARSDIAFRTRGGTVPPFPVPFRRHSQGPALFASNLGRQKSSRNVCRLQNPAQSAHIWAANRQGISAASSKRDSCHGDIQFPPAPEIRISDFAAA